MKDKIIQLEKLFCWYEFYQLCNNEIKANECQKQIESLKKELKELRKK